MEYSGPVRLITDHGDIGEVRVQLRDIIDERQPAGWGGRVVNSDHLLWGMAGHRVHLGLSDGRKVECAVHASGRLIGIGPPPWGPV
ncbi:MAG: hypothetical protein OEW42_09190 [Acidimicrobiia bacterium]|nr:hypothetical protein [Acidimicrobiia bacterium]MDH5238940.1 hypothetical protein [Acidimicrobiia bacterium]